MQREQDCWVFLIIQKDPRRPKRGWLHLRVIKRRIRTGGSAPAGWPQLFTVGLNGAFVRPRPSWLPRKTFFLVFIIFLGGNTHFTSSSLQHTHSSMFDLNCKKTVGCVFQVLWRLQVYNHDLCKQSFIGFSLFSIVNPSAERDVNQFWMSRWLSVCKKTTKSVFEFNFLARFWSPRLLMRQISESSASKRSTCSSLKFLSLVWIQAGSLQIVYHVFEPLCQTP